MRDIMLPEKPRLPDVPWRIAADAAKNGFPKALDSLWVYLGKPNCGARDMSVTCLCEHGKKVAGGPRLVKGSHFSVQVYVAACNECGTHFWWVDDVEFAKRVFKEGP